MFMGHYSAAFLAKRLAPEIPLPAYFITCQIIDICWGVFVLLGIEKMRLVPNITASNSLDLYFMPFSHGIPAALMWSILAALVFWCCAKASPQRTRTALVIGVVVGSHWILDYVVHRPDLPVWYDGLKVGFGLWDYRLPALLLELAILWGALWFSLQAVAGENRRRYVILGLVMSVVQILSLMLPTSNNVNIVVVQLLTSYLGVTVLSYWAAKQRVGISATA